MDLAERAGQMPPAPVSPLPVSPPGTQDIREALVIDDDRQLGCNPHLHGQYDPQLEQARQSPPGIQDVREALVIDDDRQLGCNPHLHGQYDPQLEQAPQSPPGTQDVREALIIDDGRQLGCNPHLHGQYDPQLEQDRLANKRKLRSRFEHIFDKYGQDFEGIADEIDLTTGDIVVSNGHLEKMEHEGDTGIGSATNISHQDRNGNREGDEQEGWSPDDEEDASKAVLASLQDSMANLQRLYNAGGTVGPGEIEALGLNIANRLTASMSRAGRKRKRNPAPQDAFGNAFHVTDPRLLERDRSVSPSAPSPTRSPPGQSLWAPLEFPKRGKTVVKNPRLVPDIHVDGIDETSDITGESTEQMPLKQCSNCGVGNSRVWRLGPDGELCNGCGMFYYRYGLLRPTESSGTDLSYATGDSDTDADGMAPITDSYVRQGAAGLRGANFTLEEDAQLIKLKEIDKLSWGKIAQCFSSRSEYALQARYSRRLRDMGREARDLLIERGHSFDTSTGTPQQSHRREGFTDAEEDALLQMREEQELPWDTIALSFPGRSSIDVEEHYNTLALKYLGSEHVAPSRTRVKQPSRSYAPYTFEDDELLIKLREKDGLSWRSLAEHFPGRTCASLQKRYVRDLAKSKATPDNWSAARASAAPQPTKYTSAEDATLVRLREVQGLSWDQIALQLPGRSATSIANRYFYKGLKRHQDISRPITLGAPAYRKQVDLQSALEPADSGSEDELA